MNELKAQRMEIAAILQRMGITRDALADRAAIKRETLRKLAMGYQKGSALVMESLRRVEQMQRMMGGGDTPALSGHDRGAGGVMSGIGSAEELDAVMGMVAENMTAAQLSAVILQVQTSSALGESAKLFWTGVLHRWLDEKFAPVDQEALKAASDELRELMMRMESRIREKEQVTPEHGRKEVRGDAQQEYRRRGNLVSDSEEIPPRNFAVRERSARHQKG